jgi:hypothetical protein
MKAIPTVGAVYDRVKKWSMVTCHRWWRFAQLSLKDVAPKAHPKMTIEH